MYMSMIVLPMLNVQVMVLVDDAGGAYPHIDHSPWNGCTLADFVMPFFLFIVGVAIALALKVFKRLVFSFSTTSNSLISFKNFVTILF